MAKSILSDAIGQVGSLGKQTVKQVVKIPKDVLETAANQAGFEKKPEVSGGETPIPQIVRNKETEDFVKGLYGTGSTESSAEQNSPDQKSQVQSQPSEQVPQSQVRSGDKSPEEQQKVQQLLNKLHQETYYQPLITRPKKQEEVEKPQERVERLEMEELQEAQKKQQKKAAQDEDIIEREQTKTEKRPGAG